MVVKLQFGPRVRAVLLFFVLAAEILALSLNYDFQPLQHSDSLIARLTGHATLIFRALVPALVALIVLGRREIPALRRRWLQSASHNPAFAWAFAAHLIFVACFAYLSRSVLRPAGAQTAGPILWLWMLSAALALLCWFAALAPHRTWTQLLQKRNLPYFALSLMIGATVCFASYSATALWYPLSDWTIAATRWTLGLIYNDVTYDPQFLMLGTDEFVVQIAPVCSGYEGIGLVAAALTFFLVLFRRELRFPQAILLLPIGIVTIWVCNVLRIATLVVIGTSISPDIALGGFHSQAGWIAFVAVTIALGVVALRSPFFSRRVSTQPAPTAARPKGRTAAYLMPLLAMIAASMITGAFSSGFDPLYPVKILVGIATLWCFARSYGRLAWPWSWLPVANGVLVLAIWMSLEPFSHIYGLQISEGLASLSAHWKMVWLFFRVFGSVIVVPIAEELAFRGYLLRRITNVDFETITYRQASWLAVVASSVLFGLLHGRWIAGSLAGLFYALAARRRNMLSDAIVAHGITNGLIAGYVLLTDSWQFWA